MSARSYGQGLVKGAVRGAVQGYMRGALKNLVEAEVRRSVGAKVLHAVRGRTCPVGGALGYTYMGEGTVDFLETAMRETITFSSRGSVR